MPTSTRRGTKGFAIGQHQFWPWQQCPVGAKGGSNSLAVTTAFEFSRHIRSFEYELSPAVSVPLGWGDHGVESGFVLGVEHALLFQRGSVKLGPNWESSLGFFTHTDLSWGVGLEVDFNGECNPASLFGRIKPAAKIMFEVEWEPNGENASAGWGIYAELKFCRR